MSADTDPVVSAQGVKAIGSTDEEQVVVTGHQYFDEVVTLVLKRYNLMKHFEKHFNLCSFSWITYSVLPLGGTHLSVGLA